MASHTIDVLGIGSPVIDQVAEVDDDIIHRIGGQKGGMELVDSEKMASIVAMLGSDTVKATGGSAANTTYALARLGTRCGFLGKIGEDDNGALFRDDFRAVGIDETRFKVAAEKPTARCVSLVTPDHERTMRTDLGAAADIRPEEIRPEDFQGCRHVHCEGYLLLNHDVVHAVLQRAKQQGCTVSLDLASFEVVDAVSDSIHELLQEYVDIVIANEEEITRIYPDVQPSEGAKQLSRLCRIAVVNVGKDGSWIACDQQAQHSRALLVRNVVDTTGAGDYWTAGFLYGYLHDMPLAVCGKIGAVLGSTVVKYMGASLSDSVWDAVAEQVGEITT